MSDQENKDDAPKLRLLEGGTDEQAAASKADPLRPQFRPAVAARDGETVKRGPQPLPHIQRLPSVDPDTYW